MELRRRSWGPAGGEPVVCVHGLAHHGGVFAALGEDLGAAGFRVVAVDLRGHGDSGREPPWSLATHVEDLLQTLDAEGAERATLVGHSFGGVVVAALAATAPQRVERLALLDPGIGLPASHALESAELDRLDWSFASVEGAVNALLSSDLLVSAPTETVSAFVADDLRRGSDGRLRFSFSPSASVVAWSEMALPPPPIAQLPTLLVRPVASVIPAREQDRRYREELGPLLKMAAVPNGHNLLWEAPAETAAALRGFLGSQG